MRILIRVDARPKIGGGHLMRCLTFADEAARRGHRVHFVMTESPMVAPACRRGHSVTTMPAQTHQPEPAPAHANWLTMPWQKDALKTAEQVRRIDPDWLVWDHYGLDARWVHGVRQAKPGLRVLALDDLDDRPLGADLVVDAAFTKSARRYPVAHLLAGPAYAFLRPEFAALRDKALARRGGEVSHMLILPGMADAAGLAPLALEAVSGMGLTGEVIMGSASQSLELVRDRIARMEGWTLTLDATDMAHRMLRADICIGAAGGTSWERCCMGLPSVTVGVAANQLPGLRILQDANASVCLTLSEISAEDLTRAVEQVRVNGAQFAQNAAALCDGRGVARVMDRVEGFAMA